MGLIFGFGKSECGNTRRTMHIESNSPEYLALVREAGIAAELLASGVTALGKANYAQHGWYNQAFFNLSIGLERAAKISIIVDYALDHSGIFPSNQELKNCGHDIKTLLDRVEEISRRRRTAKEFAERPSTAIHQGIVETLTEFAQVARYYNLDFLRGRSRASGDPLALWMARVGKPILEKHYPQKQRDKDRQKAKKLEENMSRVVSFIHHHTEAGVPLESFEAAALHSSETEVIQKYGRLYTLQIIRFLSYLLSDLGKIARRNSVERIPYLNDFFLIFINEDLVFKSRRTWSIYE
jgi:hypothetical protein